MTNEDEEEAKQFAVYRRNGRWQVRQHLSGWRAWDSTGTEHGLVWPNKDQAQTDADLWNR